MSFQINRIINFVIEVTPLATEAIMGQYLELITQDCDKKLSHPVNFSHFLPYTSFQEIDARELLDWSNNDRYTLENPNMTRLKCLCLAAATPIVHAVSIIACLANRVAKLISFAHFWHPSARDHTVCERLCLFGQDLLELALLPIFYIGLELSALYGLALPENGRKLYATFERCAFKDFLLAPCFQPSPTCHFPGTELW